MTLIQPTPSRRRIPRRLWWS
ncbi:hypothetical protein LINPERHAP2_LOCUS14915 [Linum perenne]